MVKMIWTDIKKAFSSSLSKWIGGSVFTLVILLLWSTTTSAKKIYQTPEKLENHISETQENFEVSFDNDKIQELNQVLIANKIDSFLLEQKYESMEEEEFRSETKKMLQEIRTQLYKK